MSLKRWAIVNARIAFIITFLATIGATISWFYGRYDLYLVNCVIFVINTGLVIFNYSLARKL